MTTGSNASSAIASRYAKALIELAEDSGKTAKIEQDLGELAAMIQSSKDLTMLVRSPSLSRKAQTDAILAIAKKAGFDQMTQNFLGTLAQNRRLNAIAVITAAIKKELSKRRGEVAVKVQTAQDLTPAQLKQLQDILTKGTGSKVSIEAVVEPSIMGGMIVTVGSMMIDDSVKHKLERLKASMEKQANENFAANAERA